MQLFYDDVAQVYVRRDEGVRRFFHNSIEFGWLDEFSLNGMRLLDVGSGVGRVALYVRDRVELTVGVDLSHEMLRIARERFNGDLRSWFAQCDAEFLPFAGGKFDFVTCFGLFECIANLEPYLREFYRVTAPGGHLLFTCHNREGLMPLHNSHYSTTDHTGGAIEAVVQASGYCLKRRSTIYHVNGRWIWIASRLLRPIGLDVAAIRSVVAMNHVLQESALFRRRGKVHLVLAQRP